MQVISPFVNIFQKLKQLLICALVLLLNACSFSQSNNPMDSTEELEKFGQKKGARLGALFIEAKVRLTYPTRAHRASLRKRGRGRGCRGRLPWPP